MRSSNANSNQSFYANSIGRLKSAHVYCGIALRMSISLGLHRSQYRFALVEPLQREYGCRLFWTLYLLDRLISSKLGYPLAIQDIDIDVEMPGTLGGLSPAQQEEFHDPVHLSAHTKLAKITGDILSEVYCLPNNGKNTFVRRVHRVLNDLKKFDEDLPPSLRLQGHDSARSLYTLHMHYHLCIMQTTRPILLYIFKTKIAGARQNFSPTTLALAKACVDAARTTNQLLFKLSVDGNLAVWGYFDAHYGFSSTLILIMSAVMEPAAAASDSVQMAFRLLRNQATAGNVSAKAYLGRLEYLRSRLSTARSGDEVNHLFADPEPAQELRTPALHTTLSNTSSHEDWSLSTTLFPGEDFNFNDPLGQPLVKDFLAEKAFEWPSGPSPREDTLRQFAYELGDDFVF